MFDGCDLASVFHTKLITIVMSPSVLSTISSDWILGAILCVAVKLL
jgi:hypothetical protein